ncbi:phosphoethanolamine transferase [Pinibacter soli]|uniref:Phosphoethanolamine transferase n=1 Tax=Pinibacter soli TaxID=3044211 RepID=A0ABT6R7J7_9BACT|nr:phosphoethanolamine transferase [Pinibacter soli]MDI3318418.1 phosphoethanolamine transferase [Pinibacter soli]
MLLHKEIHKGLLGLVVNSSIREATELLGWLIVPILAIVITAFFAGFYLMKQLPQKINVKTGFVASIIGLMLLSILGLANIRYYDNFYNAVSANFKNSFPTRYYFDFLNDYRNTWKISNEEYLRATKDFKFGAIRTSSTNKRRIVVLVIGESCRYDHWQINGYSRQTSPLLAKEHNLFSFHNVASGASVTHRSVPMLITRAGVETWSDHFTQKGLLYAFREAGYYTAWVSNQEKEISTANLHIADADTALIKDYNDNNNFMVANNYDENLLHPLTRLIKEKSSDIFIVLHTLGSHWDYRFRVPAGKEKFPVKDFYIFNHSLADKQNIVNAYDNTIAYTDEFLDSVITTLKMTSEEACLLFISDHGESLMDNGDYNILHAFEPCYYSIQVPLFFWFSDALVNANPHFTDGLTGNQNKAVSSAESIFYTTLHLGNIDIPSDPNFKKRDLFSSSFVESKQKVLKENNTITTLPVLKAEMNSEKRN